MALKPVTDPNLLAALGSPALPAQPVAPAPVSDPALLAQLNAPAEVPIEDQVPVPDAPGAAPAADVPEPSIWEKFKSMSGDVLSGKPLVAAYDAVTEDPVMQMWGSGLKTIAQGAPEVALNAANNFGTMVTAGVGGSFIPDPDESANFMTDFMGKNSRSATGESAQQLEAGLGEAFAPYTEGKRAAGEAVLDATGSPGLATATDVFPDLGMAIFGGPKAARGAAELPKTPLKADPVINPKVGDLRAADYRMRPSDVRAMNPGAKKIPGEFREKFASGPALKNDMTLHNQQRSTDIAAKDIGVKQLDDASLDAAEAPAASTYDMVENVLRERDMSPEFRDVLQEALDTVKIELPRGKAYTITGILGKVRSRAARFLQAADEATEAKGFALRNLADDVESALERELQAAGEPQLLKDYQDARQLFAKVNDVRSATRAGQIDANVVYKLGKRVPLSGGLKLVADAAENAPNVTGHSLKTAARAGEEVPNSREGFFTRGTKAAIRKIPGMDVGSPGFQNKFGLPDEARTSYYGRDNSVAPARGPEQQGLDLRETLDLEAPPGEVGAPQRAPRQMGPQMDALGSEFEFDMAPGEVGIPPEAPISLQDLLGLGEPLNLKNAPGRVGKPKRRP